MSTPAPEDVRRSVKALLESIPAFHQLAPGERGRLAQQMVRVMGFLVDPAAGDPRLAPVASALESAAPPDAVAKLQDRLAAKPKLVGSEFKAGAASEGAKDFKSLVSAVDFPKFVSGLIEGVFTSIVNSTIKQMREYGKLLEAVVKSLNQFAQDYITADQARNYLVDSFPSALTVGNSDDPSAPPRLQLNPELDPKDTPDFKSFLGVKDGSFNLDDPTGEKDLVAAAQLKMARMRQQELATMVLLGINRIVVTEGEIKANVLFDVKSTDFAARRAAASMDDTHQVNNWFIDDGFGTTAVQVSTVHADSTDDSEAKLAAKANLSGYVSVKFKSETFPLDRIASAGDLIKVQDRAAVAKK